MTAPALASAPGPTPGHRTVRAALVAVYVGLIVLGFVSDVQPRIFWTILLPLLPVSVVIMGFGHWRRICPLAWFGDIGRALNRGVQRRVPRWFERWFFVVTFLLLLAMLVGRLVATNGDGRWLGGLLALLALSALVTNVVFTGKTWCNFVCPVSLIERIYTEPRSLRATPNSQCTRCTACKKSCPDIDPENAYWRDLMSSGRRIATFAFPGLVLAFYVYYWLRHGDWEAYFDGRWTRHAAEAELLLGQGFFFAPQVPAVAAAILTLVGFSLISLLLFLALERAAAGLVDVERRRHLILALAAFSAFSMFYFFAGAPSLRQVPGLTRVVAFTMPLLATLFLVRRWNRSHDDFIREKSASKLLRNWPFDEPPPDDPREVYGWLKGSEHAHEQSLAAYASTVREMIADGLVHKGEMRLLDGVRLQLGISEREHDKVIERLTADERDLFEHGGATGVEGRAQLEGYQAAVAEALLRRATEAELASLRREFGVDLEVHEQLLQRMRGGSGVLVQRARDLTQEVREVREDLEVLATRPASEGLAFLTFLLQREQTEAILRVVDVLEVLGPAEKVRALRFRLFGADSESRRRVVEQLADTCSVAADVIRTLEPWIVDETPAAVEDRPGWPGVVERRLLSSDIYLRAACIWVAAETDEPWARRIVGRGLKDPDALVRETAHRVVFGEGAPPEGRFDRLATLQKMQFLRSVDLFAELAPEDLHDLCGFVTEETVPPEQALCEAGDADSDDVFILLEGRAAVIAHGDEGERRLAVLGPGEIVGEMSMIDGSPRSATVRPESEPLRVLRISGQCFRRRLLPRSRVALPLLRLLAERVRSVSR